MLRHQLSNEIDLINSLESGFTMKQLQEVMVIVVQFLVTQNLLIDNHEQAEQDSLESMGFQNEVGKAEAKNYMQNRDLYFYLVLKMRNKSPRSD